MKTIQQKLESVKKALEIARAQYDQVMTSREVEETYTMRKARALPIATKRDRLEKREQALFALTPEGKIWNASKNAFGARVTVVALKRELDQLERERDAIETCLPRLSDRNIYRDLSAHRQDILRSATLLRRRIKSASVKAERLSASSLVCCHVARVVSVSYRGARGSWQSRHDIAMYSRQGEDKKWVSKVEIYRDLGEIATQDIAQRLNNNNHYKLPTNWLNK